MNDIRKYITLVENALNGEIMEPEWKAPEFHGDWRHDRSWESDDRLVDEAWYPDYLTKVEQAEFEDFIRRNASRMIPDRGVQRERDSVGVQSKSMTYLDKALYQSEDSNLLDRAYTTSGYHDTEWWIDQQWDQKGLIDATPIDMGRSRLSGPGE